MKELSEHCQFYVISITLHCICVNTTNSNAIKDLKLSLELLVNRRVYTLKALGMQWVLGRSHFRDISENPGSMKT